MVLLGLLVLIGLIIFYSASLGLNIREDIGFVKILFSQVFFGIVLGGILLFITAKIPLSLINKYALHIFIFAFLSTFLVFIPGLGIEHGGASRWIRIFGSSFQPSELLKIGSVIFFSAWIVGVKSKIQTIKFGLLPLLILMILVTGALVLQKDTGTLMVILGTLLCMYFLVGGKVKYVLFIILIGVLGLVTIYKLGDKIGYEHAQERIEVFLHPEKSDIQGEGYQIDQSLIAVGSGGFYGKGFGQSVQKFGFLPEPMGDSIFAVFSEEWGFAGGVVLIILFLLLTFRGFKIALNTNNLFAFSLVSGIMLLVILQSFVNIGAMIGIIPLTGIPLVFVSKGGTALLIAIASMGVVLGASKGMENK